VESICRWGRTGRILAVAAAIAVVLACLVMPAGARQAPSGPEAAPSAPQFIGPNIIVALMCLAALGIPCKRYRRT
jgi:hypothetical protein